MSECVTGRCTKEGKPCLICGAKTPPPLGNKPRKYCSALCCRRATRSKYKPKPKKPRPTAICPWCGEVFARPKKTSKFCSRACRNKSRTNFYICLNCDKKYTAKNRARCAFKFCSRQCAFEARRLKKKCAERPREVVNKIASWFLSWGDDHWPHVYKCEACGGKMIQRHDGESKPARCVNCRPALRECVDCGSTAVKAYCKRCEPCFEAHNRESKRQSRRKSRRESRRLKGNAGTFRSRCRQHGAHYTPIDRSLILERDGWTCQLCSSPLLDRHTFNHDGTVDPMSPSLDHVFPLSLGQNGPGHVAHNVISCCFACNSMKGDLNPEGWSCTLDSFAAEYATRLDFRAWLKAQHQLRSTSSNFAARKKRSTGRNSAPRSTCCPSRRNGCDRLRRRCSAWSASSRRTWGRSRSRTHR